MEFEKEDNGGQVFPFCVEYGILERGSQVPEV